MWVTIGYFNCLETKLLIIKKGLLSIRFTNALLFGIYRDKHRVQHTQKEDIASI